MKLGQTVESHADLLKVVDNLLSEAGLDRKNLKGKVTFAGLDPIRETVLKVGACGVCGTDLHILKGLDGDGTGLLIIDDLVDTGRTAKTVRELLPKAHFATIYAKPSGRPLVDTYITEVSQDTWIYLPWDMGLQFTPPIGEKATA